MSAYFRWMGILGVAVLLTIAAALAPFAYRHMESFRVQRVEVRGARFIAPEATLEITGITDTSSVFDDPDAWTERLRAERLVADARVERRPPATVRIELVETEPVALIRTPALRAVDARGRVLPIDLAGAVLDAPVIIDRARLGEDDVADSMTVRLIGSLLIVRAIDPVLARQVSEVGWAGGGGLRVVLQSPDAELLLPERPDERTFREIRLAMEHVRTEIEDVPNRVARIDARYADELFVSLHPRRVN